MHDVGTQTCYWGEALQLITQLTSDTRTRTCQAVNGTKYRTTEGEQLALMLLNASNGGNEKALAKILAFEGMRERAAQNMISDAEREKATKDFLARFGIEYSEK